MRIRYHGPHDGVRIPLPPDGREVLVAHGEVIEVSDPLGRSLIEQESNWQQVPDPPKTKPAPKAVEKED